MATNIVGDGANANLSRIDPGTVLTEAQVENFNASNWDIERRFALIAMSRSPAQLDAAFCAGHEDGLRDMIESVNDWRDHLNTSIALANAAAARLNGVTLHPFKRFLGTLLADTRLSLVKHERYQ